MKVGTIMEDEETERVCVQLQEIHTKRNEQMKTRNAV